MPNIVKIYLLDNKQTRTEMSGIPLPNENSYHIIAGEEDATVFAIVSKPTQYASARYTVEMVNSQGYGIAEADITQTVTIDGVLYSAFVLPQGMAVAGYGYILIRAYINTEVVPFQTIKIKVWNTIPSWKDNVPPYEHPASQEWVQAQNYATVSYVNTYKQDKIDSDHKLSADLITEGSTNKTFTATEKTKLEGIESGAQVNVKPDWDASSGNAAEILNKPTIPTKTSDLNNDSLVPKTRTIAGVDLQDDITASELKTALDIAEVYKPQGSKTFTELNVLTKTSSMNGYVYNVSDSGTLNNYSGTISVIAGDNVAFIWNGGDWYWDNLSGIVDLSGYVLKTTTVNGHALSSNVTVTASDVGLGSVVNTGDSATPVENGTTKFTTGGAYTELAKKVDKTTTIAGIDLQDNITKQELADALGVGVYPTIAVAVAQIAGAGNDAYTTAQYIRFAPTAQQAAILMNESIQIIKLDLTALGASAPAPYVWLRRNTVVELPNPLNPTSTIPAYQFTCGGEQFWYENYQTDIAIKNIGNAALVYVEQLILDPALTPHGVADITLLNVSIPDLYKSIGNKLDKVPSPNKIYGTDSSGEQTTYDKDSFGQVDDVKVNNVSVVSNKTANIDLSGYVQKTTTIAGIDLQDNITASELKEALGIGIARLT